jgi:hypothetical protein
MRVSPYWCEANLPTSFLSLKSLGKELAQNTQKPLLNKPEISTSLGTGKFNFRLTDRVN